MNVLLGLGDRSIQSLAEIIPSADAAAMTDHIQPRLRPIDPALK